MEQKSKEFKERIVKECLEVGNIAAVARKHGLKDNAVYNWVTAYRNQNGKSSAVDELKKLQAELKDARLENAILKELIKKTNQVWLKESR
jgi:transposase-like protein